MGIKSDLGQGILQTLIKIIGQLKNTLGIRLLKICLMVDGGLDHGSLICLGYAYFFSIPEPEYAYKRYAYKKNMYIYILFKYHNIVY